MVYILSPLCVSRAWDRLSGRIRAAAMLSHGSGNYTPTHTPFLVSQGFPTNQYFRVSCLLLSVSQRSIK